MSDDISTCIWTNDKLKAPILDWVFKWPQYFVHYEQEHEIYLNDMFLLCRFFLSIIVMTLLSPSTMLLEDNTTRSCRINESRIDKSKFSPVTGVSSYKELFLRKTGPFLEVALLISISSSHACFHNADEWSTKWLLIVKLNYQSGHKVQFLSDHF